MTRPSVAGAAGWVLGLTGFLLGARRLSDNSLFTHIATGRLILDDGIPRADPYSFTARGEPWVVQSWLVSVVYGIAERMAGLTGVRIIGGLLVAALLGLVWHLAAPARSLAPRLAIVTLVVAVGAPFWSPRPLLLGLVLLCVVLVVVVGEHDSRWLVPVMWVWVNSHGSFVLGPLAVASLCAGRWVDGERERRLWRPLVWCVVGTAAGAVGPLGPQLLLFPLHLAGRMEVLARVVEWRSPDFADLYARAFLVQGAVAVLALARRPSYRSAVPLVVFTALALLGRRSLPQASLMMVPGLAVGLAGLGRLEGRERSRGAGVAVVATAVVVLLVARASLAGPAVDLRPYPIDSLAWLDQHGVLHDGRRLATEDKTGNVLEILFGRDATAFFDDRYDMYPLSLSRDYFELLDGSGDWEEILDTRGIDRVLWSSSSRLSILLRSSPRWRVVYQDAGSVLACRRGTPLGTAVTC